LVELWPYTERSRGIAFFQFFGRGANFFTTFVNPIGLQNVGWRYLISYCCFLAFEIVFIYFIFPETFGRTLEELAFCTCPKNPLWDQRVNRLDKQCSRTSRWLTRLFTLLRRLSVIMRMPVTITTHRRL
jgi:hypothetical protein